MVQGRRNGLKKERFGVFRADNNPAKWEVNRPERVPWPFRKFLQFCPDLLLAVFKFSEKSVWIVTKARLLLPRVLRLRVLSLDPK